VNYKTINTENETYNELANDKTNNTENETFNELANYKTTNTNVSFSVLLFL
jgi:hypothetical protein